MSVQSLWLVLALDIVEDHLQGGVKYEDIWRIGNPVEKVRTGAIPIQSHTRRVPDNQAPLTALRPPSPICVPRHGTPVRHKFCLNDRSETRTGSPPLAIASTRGEDGVDEPDIAEAF